MSYKKSEKDEDLSKLSLFGSRNCGKFVILEHLNYWNVEVELFSGFLWLICVLQVERE